MSDTDVKISSNKQTRINSLEAGNNNNYYYYFTAIGRSPGGSRSYTDAGKERLYVKGTIQNKVHTINKVHTATRQKIVFYRDYYTRIFKNLQIRQRAELRKFASCFCMAEIQRAK
jgi:hypothetical protein